MKRNLPAHLQNTKKESRHIPLFGGLDTETSKFSVKPGHVRAAMNLYQELNGGYRVHMGYERYSGLTKPSNATYSILYSTLSGAVNLGDVVTDDTEVAYGTVIAKTSTYLVLTAVTGVFAVGFIRIAGIAVGSCSMAQVINGGSTRKLNAQYNNLAADHYRLSIAAVPGSGSILGVWYYKGTWYGFRNNEAGDAAAMYKSSASGWTLVPLGRELSFTSGGTYEIEEGNTITGEISNATAVITRVVLESGTFAGGDAAGRLIFSSQTGTFQNETIKVGANLNVGSIAANSSAITFSIPSGKFEFVNANFTGSADTQRMFGVDGKNRAFEFDGTVFVPIDSGMPIPPSHIIDHQLQLFMSFRGSIQHSILGNPYQYSLVLGGDELGMSDIVTGFVSVPSSEDASVLGVTTRNSIGILYGTSQNTWTLRMYKRGIGAIEWTPQVVGNALMLDDRGIIKLTAAQSFGNFADGTSSKRFQGWLETKKNQVTTSCISREKNLYCVYFLDNTALYCTIENGEVKAAMPQVFAHRVSCICSTEDDTGREVVMFGSTDGFIYEMHRGTSFDGGNIEWAFDLHYDHFGAPEYEKRYYKTTAEASCDGYAEFFYTYSLGFDDPNIPQPVPESLELSVATQNWDEFTWDAFIWDEQNLQPAEFRNDGRAKNISHSFRGSSDFQNSLKFSSLLQKFKYTKEVY
jgi:hypothetical protein